MVRRMIIAAGVHHCHISEEDIGEVICKGDVYSEHAALHKASVDRMYDAYSCVCLGG